MFYHKRNDIDASTLSVASAAETDHAATVTFSFNGRIIAIDRPDGELGDWFTY